MECAIRVGLGGVPQDIEEAKNGGVYGRGLFGPFASEEEAAETLRKKGWHKPYSREEVWHPLSGIPGDRSEAEIVSRISEEQMRPPEEFPASY